jgi:hypothetical protein
LVAAITSVVLHFVDRGVAAAEDVIAARQPPISFTVSSNADLAAKACQSEMIKAGPERVVFDPRREGDHPDPHAWGKQYGGVDVGSTHLRLVIAGTSDQTVVLDNLSIKDTASDQVAEDPVYGIYEGCGGLVEARGYSSSLDAKHPRVTPNEGSPPFAFKVNPSDPEVIDFSAYSEKGMHAWHLVLDWSTGTDKGQVTIDDAGRDFVTVGDLSTLENPAYMWSWESNNWTTPYG